MPRESTLALCSWSVAMEWRPHFSISGNRQQAAGSRQQATGSRQLWPSLGGPETGPPNGDLNWALPAAQAPLGSVQAAHVKAAAAQVYARPWKLLKTTFGKRIQLLSKTASFCKRDFAKHAAYKILIDTQKLARQLTLMTSFLWNFGNTMASPSPHHRHQSLFERLITPATPAIEPSHCIRAAEISNQIIDYCERSRTETGLYRQITLLHLTYDYVLSEVLRDNFLA